MFKEYQKLDATALATLIQKKEISPLEVLEAAIQRIDEINPRINAVVSKMYDFAQAQITKLDLAAPLAGVPLLIKDLGLDIANTITSGGSRLTQNYRANADSYLITRYFNAGLISVGKTNVPEFGIMGVTESALWGPCRNPWDINLTSGGSSGGSAAAVAARMVPIATGDDGGGSIRIPASACGLFGFKPSRGLLPMGPKKNESWLGLVSGHVITRSVRDSALALDYTKGPALGAAYGPTQSIPNFMSSLQQSVKGKKVAFSKNSLLGQRIAPECVTALEHTLRACEALGMEIIEDEPPINKQELLFSYYVIVASCTAGEVARAEKLMNQRASLNNIEYSTWFLKVAGEKLRASHLEQALFVARQSTIEWDQFLQKYDFFCLPTLGDLPSPIGLMDLSSLEKFAIHFASILPLAVIIDTVKKIGARGIEKTPNTGIFNMSGHPAMSVPTYWTKDNIPIGTQFVGRMGEDQHLFTLASALESHFQWSEKMPEGIAK